MALDPVLPRVSAHLRDALANNATPLYRADWLQAKLAKDEKLVLAKSGRGPNAASKLPTFFSLALRYPICDQATLSILECRCLEVARAIDWRKHKESMKVVKEAIKLSPPQLHSLPRLSSGKVLPPEQVFQEPDERRLVDYLPRQSVDVPKRLFRNLGSSGKQLPTRFDSEDLPLLRHILDNLAANADASKGYALAKAVLARHVPLIRLLLANGADPSLKENMSVMLAVGRDDVEIVKLLVEREQEDGQSASDTAPLRNTGRQQGHGKKRKRSRSGGEGSPGKKRKLEDRLSVTSAMLELAVRQKCQPLIQYFMAKGKAVSSRQRELVLKTLHFSSGAVPNIKTLSMLQA